MPNKSKKRFARKLTARPKSVADEMAEAFPGDESGLSVDADGLGERFLSDATETGTRRRPEQLLLTDAPPTDEAVSGPNFDSEQSVWENTVDLTREAGQGGESVEDAEADEAGDDAITLDMSRDEIRETALPEEAELPEPRPRVSREKRKR